MDFTRYSPTDATSNAIRAAIMRINADAPAIAQQETDAKAARDALLLGGDRKALEAAEARLRTTRDDAERATAVASELVTRLQAAERDEAFATFTAAKADESSANERVNAYWRKNGAKLRSLLDEASEIVDARDTASSRARQAMLTAADRFPELTERLGLGVKGASIDDEVFEEWTAVLGRNAAVRSF